MARGPGPLTRPRPDTVAMPKRGKRLKFRAQDVCSGRVTVADYANSDPAVVRSGRVKKAVANAVQQEVKSLCGLEASQVPAVEALSGAGEPCDIIDSSGETDGQEESIHERTISRKKKSKRHREDLNGTGGEEYPMDIWLLLASYIRPEDIVNFSLICKNAWTVTCTAAFWTRLYRRHYTLDASLPLRLRPESMEKLHCLRACVIRSLYHMYEPFAARISKNPAIPESTPSTLKNSKTFDHRRLTVVRWDHPKADRGRVLISCWEQSSTGQTSSWTSLRLQCTISIACVGHWSRCVGSRSVCPLKPSPLFLMEQQDVQGMSEGQDSWHGGRPTPYPLGVLTFLVQKDCWEQTGTNVGIQLQVQKTGNLRKPWGEGLPRVFAGRADTISPRLKSKCMGGLQPPIQYEDVHTNPDQDCCLLQVTTLNFIFIPIVMGMIFTLFTISVSTDMRHHRVRLVFQDYPVHGGQKLRSEQGVQVILDPVHSIRLFDWWHPQYPFSLRA